MKRLAMGALLPLGAAAALLMAACAPAAPSVASPTPSGVVATATPRPATPTSAVGVPTPAVSTPGAALVATPTARVVTPTPAMATPVATRVATSTPQVMGVQVTPGTTATPGLSTAALTMMRDMDQFRSVLQQLAADAPTTTDLRAMVQQASVLMADLHQNISQMPQQDQRQALGMMSQIMGDMARVWQTHARQVGATASPGATPGPMMATPGSMMLATPVAGADPTQQMMAQIDQMRDQMMRMANAQPTEEDIITMMNQMQAVLTSMSQQVGQLSDQDLETLTGDMSQAMDDLAAVVDVHLRQEMASPSYATPSPTTTP